MQQLSKPGATDIALILLTAAIWGSAFTAVKIALPETGPFWLAASRVTIGFLALLPICIYKGVQLPKSRKQVILVLSIALLNIVIPFILISSGQQHVPAGTAAMIMGAGPFWALLVSHFFTSDDRINRKKLLAVAMGATGIIIVFGEQALNSANSIPGMLLIGAGGLCYIFAGLFMRKVDMKPIQFTTLAMGISSAILLAIAFVVDGTPTPLPSLNSTLALLWLGIFPTGLAYVLRYTLIRRVGVSMFSLGANIVPVMGVLFGAVILGEPIRLETILALALILSGLLIARWGSTPFPNSNPKG